MQTQQFIKYIMIKLIKAKFLNTGIEQTLKDAGINTQHSHITLQTITKLTNILKDPKQKAEFIVYLKQKLYNNNSKVTLSSLTLKIKLLMLVHQCVKNFPEDQQLEDLILSSSEQPINGPFKQSMKVSTSKVEDFEMIRFIHNQIVIFYQQYIKKLYANRQSIQFVNQFFDFSPHKNTREKRVPKIKQEQIREIQRMNQFESIDLINYGFGILNLGNYILLIKDPLNKMGRYHPQYLEFKSLFILLIRDIDIYNTYIKRSLALIIRRNLDKQYEQIKMIPSKSATKHRSKSKSKPKRRQSVTKQQTILSPNKSLNQLTVNQITLSTQEELSQKNNEQIKHSFLYMCECQQLSDRLYYFYFNRYYYETLKKQLAFPSFLKLEQKYQTLMKDRLKRYDYQVLQTIRASKYDKDDTTRKRSATNQINKTQGDIVQRQCEFSLDQTQINNTMTNYMDVDAFDIVPRKKGHRLKKVIEYD